MLRCVCIQNIFAAFQVVMGKYSDPFGKRNIACGRCGFHNLKSLTIINSNEKTARAAHKPNSVPGSSYLEPGNDHSSVDAGCPTPLATYPGARTGRPQTLLYSVLHRVGFT